MKNYYAILEVPIGGGLEEIRQAYRRLSQENIDNETVFADLREAYEVLTTPARRAEYDLSAWGETFVAGEPVAPPDAVPGPVGRCPMGSEGQCPVVQGRVAHADKFCPECGFLLAGLASAAQPGGVLDAAGQPRLEEPGGRSHRLRPGLNMVGREGTDVLLPDKTVSRQHARLEVRDDRSLTVEDLSSTNGTQLNGELLVPHVLRSLADGDRVRFGSVLTHLVLPQAGTHALGKPAAGVSAVPPASPGALAYPAADGATAPGGAAAVPDAGASPAGVSSSVPSAALAQVVEMRDEAARTYPLVPGVTTFGRRAESSVVIQNDPYVSGSHAQIIADGDEFRLTDLDSTNGTLLNGERLAANSPARLTDGDVLLIGGTPLRFERLGSRAEADPAAAPEASAAEAEEEPEPEAAGEVETAGAAAPAGQDPVPPVQTATPTSTEG